MSLLPNGVGLCPDFDADENLKLATDQQIVDVIIAIEIVLLVVAIGKLVYDSWRYVHYGELPWIAVKLM